MAPKCRESRAACRRSSIAQDCGIVEKGGLRHPGGREKRCSKCESENRETAKFCDGCGTPVEARCVSCGTLNRAGARFCDGCGTALSGHQPSSVQSAGAPEDRIRVTPEQAEAGALDGERKNGDPRYSPTSRGSMNLMEGRAWTPKRRARLSTSRNPPRSSRHTVEVSKYLFCKN